MYIHVHVALHSFHYCCFLFFQSLLLFFGFPMLKLHFPVDAENLCTSTIHMRPTCLHRYKVGNLRTATSHSRSHELPGAADGEGITMLGAIPRAFGVCGKGLATPPDAYGHHRPIRNDLLPVERRSPARNLEHHYRHTATREALEKARPCGKLRP